VTVYQTDADLDWQAAVARRISDRSAGILHPFGPMDEVDGWIERGGRIVSIVEIKRRKVDRTTYPTIWFALRKWQALTLASVAFGVPALFIVHYNDGIYYVRSDDVCGCPLVIGARTDRGAPNDREPVIDVPIGKLREL